LRIAIDCIEDIRLIDDACEVLPDITIKRMLDFYNSYFHFRRYPSPALNPAPINVKKYGEIEISQPILIHEIKKQILGKKYDRSDDDIKLKQVLLFTNTQQRYISALFPDPSHNIIMYEIIHREKIGALSKMAKIIKELDLNILSSFNRLVQMGTMAHWNVILDIGKNESQKIKSEIILRARKIDDDLLIDLKERHTIPYGKIFRV